MLPRRRRERTRAPICGDWTRVVRGGSGIRHGRHGDPGLRTLTSLPQRSLVSFLLTPHPVRSTVDSSSETTVSEGRGVPVAWVHLCPRPCTSLRIYASVPRLCVHLDIYVSVRSWTRHMCAITKYTRGVRGDLRSDTKPHSPSLH